MKEIAKILHNQGIASIPIKDSQSKRPADKLKWGALNSENFTTEAIDAIYSRPHTAIAVLGGYVSGGLEILDIDLKNARDPHQLWIDLLTNIGEALPEFSENCTIVKTPSGGYHIYYLCFEVMGNKKLAYEVNDGKRECVIETRGDGGYALTFPSPGYEIVTGSINALAYPLSPDERNILHEVCRMFDEEMEDEQMKDVRRHVPKGRTFIRNPFDDYRDRVSFEEVEQLIFEAGFDRPKRQGARVFYHRIGSDNPQGANWHIDRKCLYVWTSNSRLSADKAYSAPTMLCELRFNGDWKEVYKHLIREGYGEKIQTEDEEWIQKAHKRLEAGESKENILPDLPPDKSEIYAEIAENRLVRMEKFWDESEEGKVTVDIVRLKRFLENRGFRKYRFSYSDQDTILVRILEDKHIIKEVDIEYIKEFLEAYLLDEELAIPVRLQEDVMRSLMNMTTRFFRDAMFEWLEAVIEGEHIKILKDTSQESYFFFQNHFVKITATKPEILTYDKLDKNLLVWEKDVIKREITLVNIKDNANDSEYFRFIKRLVLMGPDTDKDKLDDLQSHESFDKLRAFITTIGYLCHRHNDRRRPWSVIIAEDILNSHDGGGTGKGIFMSSLAKARKAIYEAGKSFDPTSQFAFQKWEPGTDIYLIDDVGRKFDFESMYNFISDGGTIERKYHRAFQLPFKSLPKFVFSTNYGDMADGSTHGERRRKLLLVGKYYGPHLTPYEEFGHNLFSEWDDNQWNLFYNVIFYCIQQFLKNDVVDFPASDNVKIKTFLSDYGSELFEFFEELKSRDWVVPVLLSDLRNEFHNMYDRKNFSAQLFKIALDKYCRMFGVKIEESLGTSRANHKKKMVILRCGVSSNEGLPHISDENTRKVDDLPF